MSKLAASPSEMGHQVPPAFVLPTCSHHERKKPIKQHAGDEFTKGFGQTVQGFVVAAGVVGLAAMRSAIMQPWCRPRLS
eukprot:6465419-Amphidinium_carterae.5